MSFSVDQNIVIMSKSKRNKTFQQTNKHMNVPTLTHFRSMLLFYTPSEHQETSSFLFSTGIEKEHWLEMGWLEITHQRLIQELNLGGGSQPLSLYQALPGRPKMQLGSLKAATPPLGSGRRLPKIAFFSPILSAVFRNAFLFLQELLLL